MANPPAPELMIPFDNESFRFVRSLETAIFGEGNWITLKPWKGLPPNTIVPMAVQVDLSNIARIRGIPEEYNYRHNLPKVEHKPVSAEKTPGVKTKKKGDSTLMSGFNPFAKK